MCTHYSHIALHRVVCSHFHSVTDLYSSNVHFAKSHFSLMQLLLFTISLFHTVSRMSVAEENKKCCPSLLFFSLASLHSLPIARHSCTLLFTPYFLSNFACFRTKSKAYWLFVTRSLGKHVCFTKFCPYLSNGSA